MGGAEFQPRVILAQEAKLTANSKCEVLTVGTVAKKIELTVEPQGESQLMLCGDVNNASVLYIGLSNAVSSSNYFCTLSQNEKMVLTIDSVTPPDIWAVGTSATDKVAVLKGV